MHMITQPGQVNQQMLDHVLWNKSRTENKQISPNWKTQSSFSKFQQVWVSLDELMRLCCVTRRRWTSHLYFDFCAMVSMNFFYCGIFKVMFLGSFARYGVRISFIAIMTVVLFFFFLCVLEANWLGEETAAQREVWSLWPCRWKSNV